MVDALVQRKQESEQVSIPPEAELFISSNTLIWWETIASDGPNCASQKSQIHCNSSLRAVFK